MIGKALVFLRKQLDDRLRAEFGVPDDPTGDKVVFIDGDKMDPMTFKNGAVSVLLINLEEERALRRADPYVRVAQDGTRQRVQPDIRLMLYVLFVARFKQYDLAWDHLSKVVEYLQSNPVFETADTPSLPPGIDKLALELVTLKFAEQNEVWNALRATHHPSVLYRVKLLVVRDDNAVDQGLITQPPVVQVEQLPS